ncbi:hypothetical protein BD560DRAFT_487438 [Blakeslea trispora]|nr:hypothetical protein BD560DRAFT_487438 [Blakeslea trispora]
MSEKYKNLKVKELQELLQKNSLPVSGKKEDLIARLVKNDERIALESLEKEFELDGDFDETKLNLNDISHDMLEPIPMEKPSSSVTEKESVLSDDDEVDFVIAQKSKERKASDKTKTIVTVEQTTVVETKTENVAPTDEKKSNEKVKVDKEAKNSFKFTPITFDKPTVSSAGKATPKPATIKKPEPTKKEKAKLDEVAEKLRLEAERRLERSKRFGVKLDEKEMKQIRAARFGLLAKEEEEQKKNKKNKKPDSPEDILKKRAERFGLPLEKEAKKEPKNDIKKENKNVVKQEDKKKEIKKNSVDQKKKIIQKKALNLKKIQKGRINKPSAPSTTTAAIGNKVTATKAKVLNTKQQNVNKLAEGTIRQTKKNIINQRKANIPNTINKNNNGRTITIQTKSNPVEKAIPSGKKTVNGRRIEIQQPVKQVAIQANRNGGRKVIINPDNKRKPLPEKQVNRKRTQPQTQTPCIFEIFLLFFCMHAQMTDPLTITHNQYQTEQICESPTALWSGEDYQTSVEAILQSIALVKQLLTEQPYLLGHKDDSELDTWAQRLLHSNSKILITGDLNSGKSTLVNALLKTPELLPVDQQPCTSMFCQVYNAPQQRDPLLHAFNDIHLYQPHDPSTYTVIPFDQLYDLLTLEEPPFKMLRLYTDLTPHPSLIAHHQITLIDSPGLNTDSIRSTTEYAQEEEMDAVVFVVNAENHFTLSGRAFLQSITQPNVFIAVNKFDHIRDKERCKRLILEQIRDVSPLLYEQADQLVHFVSAAYGADATGFRQLEESLCRFVLQIRLESKLLPIQKSLLDYTRTMVSQAKQRTDQTQHQLDQLASELDVFLKDYARLVEAQHQIKHTFHPFIQQTVINTREAFTSQLDPSSLWADVIQQVQYQGMHRIWSYAQSMRQGLYTSLNQRLAWMEQEANRQTETCRRQMYQCIAEQIGQPPSWTSQTEQLKRDNRAEVDLQVQLSDLLCNRMDDKKLSLTTASLAILLLETETLQQQGVYWLSRLLKPMTAHASHQYARQVIGWSLTCISLVSVGWTAYAFLSDMPGALETNLKRKFELAMERAQRWNRLNGSVKWDNGFI